MYIPIVHDGFDLLGTPIGFTSYCEAMFVKRVREVEEVSARLPDLQGSQWSQHSSIPVLPSLYTVTFALRTCVPS